MALRVVGVQVGVDLGYHDGRVVQVFFDPFGGDDRVGLCGLLGQVLLPWGLRVVTIGQSAALVSTHYGMRAVSGLFSVGSALDDPRLTSFSAILSS